MAKLRLLYSIDMVTDTSNPIFDLAVQFVNQTGKSVFLTGKAGTGKTTFLKYIRENSFKKMAVVAPTGVAAINAGGTTLHSFFQLPFGPYVPTPQPGWDKDHSGVTDPNTLFSNIRFNGNKRELLQELELLVIDEISMVRADVLDAVDAILRHFRQQPLLPFGGVQMLYIGDLFQLPPVVSNEEWELLKPHYKSPFFFDAQALQQAAPFYLELKKIYRQNEAGFINILNNIRNNRASRQDLDQLHEYYQPDFTPPKDANYITLTSHNAKADGINQTELGKLRGKQHAFEASVTGEFNDKAFPAEKTLNLKEGAQIMLIKNDKGETRRYFNGKIGTIKKISGDKITILFPNEPDELTLEKETWKNIRYQYDKEKDKVEEEELGTFSQYPIRLAWAITIHKSQGLTFDKAVIDAGASFAPGQVYVALSRLTSLNGLVLRSRILPHSISTDERVIGFTESRLSDSALEEQLREEQLFYISQSLVRSFSWSKLLEQLQAHYAGFDHRQMPDKVKAIELARGWLDKTLLQQETAAKFSRQLDQLLITAAEDGYRQLQQRTQAGVNYFRKGLEEDLLQPLQQHISEIRVKQKVKKYLQTLQELKTLFTRKKQQIEEALQMVEGLMKGVAAANLLSDLQEQRKAREAAPAEGPAATDANGKPQTTKPQKGETHRISLQLYKEGVSIADIATQRGLAATTVESHLASFIPTGEIDIKELVPEKKMSRIIAAIKEIGGAALGPIKSRLGEDCSFGEIRSVMTWLRYTESTPFSNSSPD
ncbi:MAG TPA: helix-turn-helix domain-containing protein [Puia sp.]|nr:helix-turn-helix domain-containing protein [Puia sp.]